METQAIIEETRETYFALNNALVDLKHAVEELERANKKLGEKLGIEDYDTPAIDRKGDY